MNARLAGVSTVEIDRILQSATFRSSEVSRRLLRFLAEKAVAGEADQLKEYSIGIDALGKPPSFDPRTDSIVRLQASRLRQKLGEYYRTEGKSDPVVVDLPKGSFRLTWHPRPEPGQEPHSPVGSESSLPVRTESRLQRYKGRHIWLISGLGIALLLLAVWNVWLSSRLRSAEEENKASEMWTPALHDLWDPLISNSRPLLVAFPDPIFAGVLNRDGNIVGYLRMDGMRNWGDVEKSPAVQSLRNALGNPSIQPRFDLVGRGYLDFVLRLGRLLGTRKRRMSVARLSEISWESLSENDVIFAGGKGSNLDNRLAELPVRQEFTIVSEGVRNLHPGSGEPAILADSRPAGVDGQVYAVVSVLPGPLGVTRVHSFASNRWWGNVGAMEWFTDPDFAKFLVGKLKAASRSIPAFYQVVLKVKYKDGVPTEITYVTHRALPTPSATAAERQ